MARKKPDGIKTENHKVEEKTVQNGFKLNLSLMTELIKNLEDALNSITNEKERGKKTFRSSDLLKKAADRLETDGTHLTLPAMRSMVKDTWKKATLLHVMEQLPLIHVLAILRSYCGSELCFSLLPDCPKKPMSAYKIFMSEYCKKIQKENPALDFAGITKAASALWQNTESIRLGYEGIHRKAMKKYNKRLRRFYDNNSNIEAVQIEQEKISRRENRSQKIAETKRIKEEKRQNELAFEAFLQHKAHYAAKYGVKKKSTEFRVKMRKKFDNFDQEKLQKYRERAREMAGNLNGEREVQKAGNSNQETAGRVKKEATAQKGIIHKLYNAE